MKKLLLMMLVLGACSISIKQEFINQVAGKDTTMGCFYSNGDFEDSTYGVFTIYEVIDSNTAIYKATEKEVGKDFYIYLKFEIKNGKIYATLDYNSATAEQAKNSTTVDVSL